MNRHKVMHFLKLMKLNLYFNCMVKKLRSKVILSLLVVLGIFLGYIFGLYAYIFAQSFNELNYPLEGEIQEDIAALKAGRKPVRSPINIYNYSFLLSNDTKCKDLKNTSRPLNIRLLLLIKSAISNQENRNAIRQSWGWEKRFSDVKIRTVFLLGIHSDKILQEDIEKEHLKYGDIVQSDFSDTYYNNTIKTMQGFRWAVEKCPTAQFYLFSDDDMYVSIKNVLRFIRNPAHYPKYLTRAILQVPKGLDPEFEPFNIDETPIELFAGYVFSSRPLRMVYSKWHISLEEYPYSRYPPYVSAGVFVMSRETLLKLYYTSLYTKHFRFDDVYLGIVAKKANVKPEHNEEFYFYKKNYDKYLYKYVIASHGYGDVREMLNVWHEQRSLGNA